MEKVFFAFSLFLVGDFFSLNNLVGGGGGGGGLEGITVVVFIILD